MDAVLKGLFIYFFLLVLTSVAGKRSMAQVDTFSFVLLLIISEASQNALVGRDYSVTYSVLLILTLVGTEILMSWLRARKPVVERALSGGPLVLVANGVPLRERMKRSLVDDDEILSSARVSHGLERMAQIKFAILETSGEISIIPREEDEAA